MNMAERRVGTGSLQERVFSAGGGAPFEGLIDLGSILAALRRQWKPIVIGTCMGLVLAIVYIVVAKPLYTGAATILIDKRQTLLTDRPVGVDGVFKDDAAILSEVELIRSRRLQNKVIEQFNLDADTNFVRSYNSAAMTSVVDGIGTLLAPLTALFDDEEPTGPEFEQRAREKRRERIYSRFDKHVDVTRVPSTYVLEVSVTAPQAGLSARLATAFAEAYLNDQIAARFEAAQRVNSWLLQRIEEVKEQSSRADSEIIRFRAENNLDAVSGKLLGEQQQQDLTTQLTSAKIILDQAQAKLSQVRAVIATGNPDSAVTDLLQNETVRTLRERYLMAEREEAEITRKLGRDHLQAKQRRESMAEFQKQIDSELRRIASAYESDYQISKERYDQLDQALRQSTQGKVEASAMLIQLKQKEQQAATLHQLHANLLKRFSETMNERDFPISEARVIGLPVVPSKPSKPNWILVLAAGLVAGLGLGGLFGLWREFRERFFRTSEQVTQVLGMPCFGYVPRLDPAPLPTRDGGGFALTDRRMRHVRDMPMSVFAETIRSARLTLERRREESGRSIIGVISALPHEGKSLNAMNLAWLLASAGDRQVLVVDADLRNPGLTRAVAPRATAGLTEVLVDRLPLHQALLQTDLPNVSFLPCVPRMRWLDSADLLSSSIMASFLKLAAEKYDHIVLDLPPLSPIVDAKAMADLIDSFVLVVRWGQTSQAVVRQKVVEDARIADRCIGVILNGVEMNKLPYYSEQEQDDYYSSDMYGTYIKNP